MVYSALLVDDDYWALKDIRSILKLEEYGFDRIEELNSAEEAIARILSGCACDLIITDVRMGEISGLDLIRICRRNHVDSIFVMVSAYCDFDYISEAFRQEAFDYLLKPVSKEKAQQLMVRLLSKLEKKQGASLNQCDKKELDPVELALDYIRKNYAKPITLEETANACHMSKGYLSIMMKKQVGMSFLQFRNYLRMIAAKRLLQDSNANITETAAAVGCFDANYFSRIFKQTVGMTPREYQRMIKK